MRRILVITVLTAAMSAVAFSQTTDEQTKPSQSEQELITLSREFVKTSIGVMAVEKGGVKMTPFGPMPSLEVKEQWEAVGIKDTKIRIDGDSAIVTGQATFGGQAPDDKTLNSSSSVIIHFHRQKEQWKLMKGCFGECGEK